MDDTCTVGEMTLINIHCPQTKNVQKERTADELVSFPSEESYLCELNICNQSSVYMHLIPLLLYHISPRTLVAINQEKM
jgi:hypothetical protein